MDRAKKRERIAKLLKRELPKTKIPMKEIAEAAKVPYGTIIGALRDEQAALYDVDSLAKNTAKGIRRLAKRSLKIADRIDEGVAKLNGKDDP